MYLSHLDAHARGIEELSGKRPVRGRSMYIENQQTLSGVIDDTRIYTRPHRNPLARRPVSIHFGTLSKDIMAGNYVTGWEQPREQSDVGQQIIFSAGQKLEHQQSYPQRSNAGGRRPFGRYGSRPSSDSTELVGGSPAYNPKGNRAADMFKRAKEHTDQFAIDDEAITPQAVQKARHGGVDDYDLPKQKVKSQQQSRPVARPAARPVSQPAPKPVSPAASYSTDYGAPQQRQQQQQQQQQQAQRQQQPQRQQQQQQPARQPAPQQSYANTYGQTGNGPKYNAKTRQHANQQQPATGCTWGKDNVSKKFHSGVQPYEDSYNRSAQGWSSQYRDTLSDEDIDVYDPFAPRKSPNYKAAPKVVSTRSVSTRQTTEFNDFNKRAKGWNPIGLDEEDAEALYSANRQPLSTLSSAFEEPRPQYGGGQQRAAQARPSQARPAQQQQQQRRPPQQQQQQRPPQQQQRMSSTAPYAVGSGGWGGMLESDDL